MQLDQQQIDNIYVVSLSGRVDELASPHLDRALGELIGAGAREVVLDLGGVEYISSSGLRVLLLLLRTMQAHNGRVKLSTLSPFVAEVFKVTNYHRIFEVYPTSGEAVAAFASSRP